MSCYFIDYENVNISGIEGVKNLKPEDTVYIFYSEQIKNILFEKCIELVKSKAKIEFIKISKPGKNSLDFQLATYLGYILGKEKKQSIYIISKDTGFDCIIAFWKGRSVDIHRKESIKKNIHKN